MEHEPLHSSRARPARDDADRHQEGSPASRGREPAHPAAHQPREAERSLDVVARSPRGAQGEDGRRACQARRRARRVGRRPGDARHPVGLPDRRHQEPDGLEASHPGDRNDLAAVWRRAHGAWPAVHLLCLQARAGNARHRSEEDSPRAHAGPKHRDGDARDGRHGNAGHGSHGNARDARDARSAKPSTATGVQHRSPRGARIRSAH